MLLQTEEWQGREAVEEQMSTHALHMTLVERVIQMMHVYVAESLSLEDMADIACLSPYYFNRIFHQHIGIPPGEFFATLRLHVAKQLLLTTEASITEICFSIGYSGLGSFTTRFTQLVGLSPSRLRHLARNEPITLSVVQRRVTKLAGLQLPSPWRISGQIRSEEFTQGNIFVGLFPKPIPQGRPVSCTLLAAPGPFQLAPVPPGKYALMVAALPASPDPLVYLLPTSRLLVGIFAPLVVAPGRVPEQVDILLRPTCLTDPPIICALPYL